MKIDHIGIATRTLEETTALWQAALGLEVESTEDVGEQGVHSHRAFGATDRRIADRKISG